MKKTTRPTNWQKRREAEQKEALQIIFNFLTVGVLCLAFALSWVANKRMDQIDADIEAMWAIVAEWEATDGDHR